MISLKIGGIIAVAFIVGAFVASPVQKAIAAVIATDVQCAGCVGTSDLAGNGVTAAKIKDGEVRAAEIATNAVGSSELAANSVGASELVGVTKLIFAECNMPANSNLASGAQIFKLCSVEGVNFGDNVVVSQNHHYCLAVTQSFPQPDAVGVSLTNVCNFVVGTSVGNVSIVVYNK
jgi:hypothetical protein